MKRKDISNVYLYDTAIENIVINEYLIFAPENVIKVYLLSMMYISMGKEIDDREIIKTMGISTEELSKVWHYLYSKKLIALEGDKKIFLNIKERFYCGDDIEQYEKEDNAELVSHPLIDNKVAELIRGVEQVTQKTLSMVEVEKLTDLVDVFSMSSEVIIYGFKYCYDRGKSNPKYIFKVLENWLEKGLFSIEDIEKDLAQNDKYHHIYRRIGKALGLTRNLTEAERELVDGWINLGVNLDIMIEACGKTTHISNPSIKYVDSVIKNTLREKKGIDEQGKVTRKKLGDYLQYLRDKAEDDAKNKVSQIESKLPELTIIKDKIRKLTLENMKKKLASGSGDKHIDTEIKRLQKDINMILHRNNIPADYDKIEYRCRICKDTGILEDGSNCSCLIDREKEAIKWQS